MEKDSAEGMLEMIAKVTTIIVAAYALKAALDTLTEAVADVTTSGTSHLTLVKVDRPEFDPEHPSLRQVSDDEIETFRRQLRGEDIQ